MILTKIALDSSLRYAIQLISTSNLVARRRKSPEITIEDVKKCYSLFLDENRSSRVLKEYESEYMFNEIEERPQAMDVGQ
jgi:RuvB-like protein 2